MSVEHESLPIVGVQFHPESILTEHGHQILQNFLSIAGCANETGEQRYLCSNLSNRETRDHGSDAASIRAMTNRTS